MFDDTERPARVRAEQDRALRQYVRRQVYPYSVFNRQRMVAAGMGPGGIQSIADLVRLPTVTWDEVGDGADLVLRPLETTITRLGSPGLAFRVLFARATGRRANLNTSLIDPLYRPIRWLVQDGIPVGYTANDLERLGEIGRRWLQAAGVRIDDMIVSLVPVGPTLAFWELTAASRRAGVSTVFLEPSPDIDVLRRIHPTVLAGRADDVLALLAQHGDDAALSEVHTVLAVGDLVDDETRSALRRRLPSGAEVVAAWAPPGVRALWGECRGGTGLHTWPAAEILEVVNGEIAWTALGWAGSVLLRLATGARATLDETTCPQCGRTTARVVSGPAAEETWAATERLPLPDTPPPPPPRAIFEPVLDDHPGVAAWQGELARRNGDEELVVFVAPSRPGHPGRLIRDLDEQLRMFQPATQFVVLSKEAVEERLARHGNTQVVDNR